MAKETTINLYKTIRTDFDVLSAKKEYGVAKYSLPWILHHLANKYYKSAKTIENIVFHRTVV